MVSSLESAPSACRRVVAPQKQYANAVCSYDGCGGVNSALLSCGNLICNATNKMAHRACEKSMHKGIASTWSYSLGVLGAQLSLLEKRI
jgi:hypothetical protein